MRSFTSLLSALLFLLVLSTSVIASPEPAKSKSKGSKSGGSGGEEDQPQCEVVNTQASATITYNGACATVCPTVLGTSLSTNLANYRCQDVNTGSSTAAKVGITAVLAAGTMLGAVFVAML